MAGRTALATPTDVYPRNGQPVVFDADDQFPLTFTNWCDSLSYLRVVMFDATTNKEVASVVYHWWGAPDTYYLWQKGSTPKIYIDRLWGQGEYGEFISGRHYKYNLIMYAGIPDINNEHQNLPNCCVPYASGKIEWAQNYHKFKIASGIKHLAEPEIWGDTGQIIGCTKMRIAGEERMVVDYDSETGMVTVESDFSQDVADNINNAQYFLNCNFISTSGSETEGSYDFYIREEIQSATTTYNVPVGLRVKNTYFHPNSVGLENYQMRVYQTEGNAYHNGTIQASTEETASTVDLRNILIGTDIVENIVGKQIIVEPSLGASQTAKVSEGYSSTIIGYNSTYGLAMLSTALPVIPEVGTKYTIYLSTDTLVGESEKVYNYNLIYNFPIYTLGETFMVETTLTTYEKQQTTISKRVEIEMPEQDSPITSHSVTVDKENQNIILGLTGTRPLVRYESDGYNIFRREAGEYLWKLSGFISLGTSMQYIDYLAGNNREYEYLISRTVKPTTTYVPADNYKPYQINGVKTSWDGWTITAITPYTDFIKRYAYSDRVVGKYARHLTKEEVRTSADFSILSMVFAKEPYVVGETWKFISDIDSGDITHNLGLNVHVGTSALPTVTRTNNMYQSGSFRTRILSLECPSGEIYDNIEKVERWNKFITGNNAFILRSDKGDVWVVAISDNPSRTYDETFNPILTSVSYSWVEIMKPEDVEIIQFDV